MSSKKDRILPFCPCLMLHLIYDWLMKFCGCFPDNRNFCNPAFGLCCKNSAWRVNSAIGSLSKFCVAVAQLVPQECTPEMSGLLYFDLLSSRMYRCTGREWTEWGSTGSHGLHYTALLRDSAAAPPDTETEPPDVASETDGRHDDDDDDVAAMTSSRQQPAGRGSRKTCRQGQTSAFSFCLQILSSTDKWQINFCSCYLLLILFVVLPKVNVVTRSYI